jgi:hypothetical protein
MAVGVALMDGTDAQALTVKLKTASATTIRSNKALILSPEF